MVGSKGCTSTFSQAPPSAVQSSTSTFSQAPPSNLKNVFNPYGSDIPSPTFSQEDFYNRLESLLSAQEDKKKCQASPRSRSQSPLHQRAHQYADKAGITHHKNLEEVIKKLVKASKNSGSIRFSFPHNYAQRREYFDL